jgi:hypothetical protein
VVGLVVVLALLVVAAGCGGGGSGQGEKAEQQPVEEQQTPVVGEFVGDVSDADAFFALIAEEPQETDERNIRAYLCDGKQLTEWFTGTASGDQVELSSENGVGLEGTLDPEAATGTITLSDGATIGFEAPLASGPDGFYAVNVPASGGSFSATSFSGALLEGTRSGGEEVSGTITPPEGEAVEFGVSDPNLEEGEDRWIVLSEDGQLRIKGAKRRATSSGLIDPGSDHKRPGFTNQLIDPNPDF